jgi:glutamate dehydrogenase
MRAAARDLDPADAWDRLALQRVADDLPRQQAELASLAIIAAQSDGVPPGMIDADAARQLVELWIAPKKDVAARLREPMATFSRSGVWSLAKLVLLGDAVREFVYASRADAPAPKR